MANGYPQEKPQEEPKDRRAEALRILRGEGPAPPAPAPAPVEETVDERDTEGGFVPPAAVTDPELIPRRVPDPTAALKTAWGAARTLTSTLGERLEARSEPPPPPPLPPLAEARTTTQLALTGPEVRKPILSPMEQLGAVPVEAGRGLAAGTVHMEAAAGELVQAAGADSLGKRMERQAEGVTEKIPPPAGNLMEALDRPDLLAPYIAHQVGRNLPNLGVTIGAGVGAGAVGGVVGGAIAGPPGAAVGAWGGSRLGVFAASWGLNYADMVDELEEEGKLPEDDARLLAMAYAVPIAMLDMVVPVRLTGKIANPLEKAAGRKWARSAIAALQEGKYEGLTEATQEFIQALVTAGYSEEVDFRFWDVFGRVIEGGLIGSIVGGGAGAAVEMVRSEAPPKALTGAGQTLIELRDTHAELALEKIRQLRYRGREVETSEPVPEPEPPIEAKPATPEPRGEGAPVEGGPVPLDERGGLSAPGFFSLPTELLAVDPARFQYKLEGIDPKTGVSKDLAEVKVWNQNLAGAIGVWWEESTGTWWTVEGHHRRELAHRLGVERVNVFELVDEAGRPVETAAGARAAAALKNIAEGRGTIFDAAKFFRDAEDAAEVVTRSGISMREQTVAKGLAISQLSDGAFESYRKGVNGRPWPEGLPQERAVMLGGSGLSVAAQDDILAQAKTVMGLRNEDFEGLIAIAKGAAEEQVTTDDLFGTTESQTDVLERMEIYGFLKRRLAEDRIDFAKLTERTAERLQDAGLIEGIADPAKAKERARLAAQVEEIFKRDAASAGTVVTEAIKAAVDRTRSGQDAEAVREETYAKIRDHIAERIARGLGTSGPVGGEGTTPGPAPAGEPGIPEPAPEGGGGIHDPLGGIAQSTRVRQAKLLAEMQDIDFQGRSLDVILDVARIMMHGGQLLPDVDPVVQQIAQPLAEHMMGLTEEEIADVITDYQGGGTLTGETTDIASPTPFWQAADEQNEQWIADAYAQTYRVDPATMFRLAVKRYGTTDNARAGAWINPNGDMLYFGGPHRNAHEAIARVFKDAGVPVLTGKLGIFAYEALGGVRHAGMPIQQLGYETPPSVSTPREMPAWMIVEFMRKPTPEQVQTLQRNVMQLGQRRPMDVVIDVMGEESQVVASRRNQSMLASELPGMIDAIWAHSRKVVEGVEGPPTGSLSAELQDDMFGEGEYKAGGPQRELLPEGEAENAPPPAAHTKALETIKRLDKKVSAGLFMTPAEKQEYQEALVTLGAGQVTVEGAEEPAGPVPLPLDEEGGLSASLSSMEGTPDESITDVDMVTSMEADHWMRDVAAKAQLPPEFFPAEIPHLRPRSLIMKDLSKALMVPIRLFRMRMRPGLMGYFKVVPRTIRLKWAQDMETAAHEIGHSLHELIFREAGLTPSGWLSQKILAPWKEELAPLGVGVSDESLLEGEAEFWRRWFTNPEVAQLSAPRFYAAMMDMLERSEPKVLAQMEAARDNYRLFIDAPAEARFESNIVRSSERQELDLPYSLRRFYQGLLHNIAPIEQMQKYLTGGERPASVWEDAATLAQWAQSSAGPADHMITRWQYRLINDRAEATGPSLEAILRPVSEVDLPGGKTEIKRLRRRIGLWFRYRRVPVPPLQAFDWYMIARRTLALAERKEPTRKLVGGGKASFETGFRVEDAQEIVERYGKIPEFVEAFEGIQNYRHNLLMYMVDSGLYSMSTVMLIERVSKDFAPFHVVADDAIRQMSHVPGTPGKNRLANIVRPLKFFKSGTRRIRSPLESMYDDTYAFLSVAHRQMTSKAIFDQARKRGAGWFFEHVARPIEPIRFPADEALLQLAQLMPEIEELVEGMEPEEIAQLANEVLLTFRPGTFGLDERNVVSYMQPDGSRTWFEIQDPGLYDALMGMERGDWGIAGKIVTMPPFARLLRLGATLPLGFSFYRNPARDTPTAFVFSEYGMRPVIDHVRGVAMLFGKGERYDAWLRSSAPFKTLLDLDRKSVRRRIEHLGHKPWGNVLRHPIENLMIAGTYMENLNRSAGFQRAYDKEIAKGTPPAQAEIYAGVEAMNISVNFRGHGTHTRTLRLGAGLWNARMMSYKTGVQKFRKNPYSFTLKATGAFTVPELMDWAANVVFADDEDREAYFALPQIMRDLFWMVPVPKLVGKAPGIVSDEESGFMHRAWAPIVEEGSRTWIRIPKGFELALIFGTLPRRFLDWLYLDDPEGIRKAVWESLVRPLAMETLPLPTFAMPVMENLFNYDTWRHQPLEPKRLEGVDPNMRYTEYTSELGKGLSNMTGGVWSPIKFDNLITGWAATAGRGLLDTSDAALDAIGITDEPPKMRSLLERLPLVGAMFVRQPQWTTENVDRFYDRWRETDRRYRTWNLKIRQLDFDGAMRYQERHLSEISLAGVYRGAAAILQATSTMRRLITNLPESRMSDQEKLTGIRALAIIRDRVARAAMRNAPGDFEHLSDELPKWQNFLESMERGAPRERELGAPPDLERAQRALEALR